MKNLIAIASSGGHLSQLMAVCSSLNGFYLVSNKTDIEKENIISKFKVIDTQFNVMIHALNFFIAIYIMIKTKPDIVISTGGPICLPFALLCRIFRVDMVYIDTLSRADELSNTGSFLLNYKLCRNIYSQWKNVANDRKVNYQGQCFGILGGNRTTNKVVSGEVKKLILVTLGTNKYEFSRMFDVIKNDHRYFNSDYHWIIQSGVTKIPKVLPASHTVCEYLSRQEIQRYYIDACLVYSHCGVGSIKSSLEYSKPTYLVPRLKKLNEFSDDHQLQIAKKIKDNSLFSVLDENETNNELTPLKSSDKVYFSDVLNSEFSNYIKHKYLT